MAFHINPASGEPGACKAEVACPFGTPDEHFETKDDARKAYEKVMSGSTWTSPELQAWSAHVVKREAAETVYAEKVKTYEAAKGSRPTEDHGAKELQRRASTLATYYSLERDLMLAAHPELEGGQDQAQLVHREAGFSTEAKLHQINRLWAEINAGKNLVENNARMDVLQEEYHDCEDRTQRTWGDYCRAKWREEDEAHARAKAARV